MNKKNYIMVKAYLNNNVGDDLFVHILANRYPNQVFYVMDQYGKKVRFPNNILNCFNCFDQCLKKIDDKIWWNINKIFGIKMDRKKSVIWKYFVLKENWFTRNAKECIYVTGSGFIETENSWDSEYFSSELKYYEQKPVVIGCNFGPYQTMDYLREYKKLFRMAKDVCFRDQYSKSLFESLPNIRCEMDIVFNYDLGEKIIWKNQCEKKYVLISVVDPCKESNNSLNDRQTYVKFIKECVEYCYKLGLEVVFVGFCRNQKDDYIIEEIISDLCIKDKVSVFNYPDITYQEIMGLFKYADSVIASRYHAMIIAMLYKKTVYPIAYSEKTVHVMEDIVPSAQVALLHDLGKLTADVFFSTYGYKISKQRLIEVKKSADRQFLYLDKLLKDE